MDLLSRDFSDNCDTKIRKVRHVECSSISSKVTNRNLYVLYVCVIMSKL